MQEIDIFIDLEGLGVGRPKYVEVEKKVNSVLTALPDGLMKEGFRVRGIWATACVRRKRSLLPGTLQIALKRVFIRHRGELVWTTEVADDALKKEVQRRLTAGILAQAVLLVTNDHDFGPLVIQLVQADRFVIVSGHQVSKHLIRVASKTIVLDELCGREIYTPIEAPPIPLNPIVLP